MKLSLIAFVIALSPAAFACPNLTGAWTCTAEGQTSTMSVTQQDIPNGVLYTSTNADGTEQMYVDGQPHSTTDNQGTVITQTLTCASDTMINGTMNLVTADKSVSVDANMMLMLSGNSLTMSSDANIHQPNQPDQKQTSSSSCTRN